VVQRAVIHEQSLGRDTVTGAHLLVAIFAEPESHAAWFLQEQGLSRDAAANFIAQRSGKDSANAGAGPPPRRLVVEKIKRRRK
jgi:ATP-dependent Clp protease ATP-binding subunit ClpA